MANVATLMEESRFLQSMHWSCVKGAWKPVLFIVKKFESFLTEPIPVPILNPFSILVAIKCKDRKGCRMEERKEGRLCEDSSGFPDSEITKNSIPFHTVQ